MSAKLNQVPPLERLATARLDIKIRFFGTNRLSTARQALLVFLSETLVCVVLPLCVTNEWGFLAIAGTHWYRCNAKQREVVLKLISNVCSINFSVSHCAVFRKDSINFTRQRKTPRLCQSQLWDALSILRSGFSAKETFGLPSHRRRHPALKWTLNVTHQCFVIFSQGARYTAGRFLLSAAAILLVFSFRR